MKTYTFLYFDSLDDHVNFSPKTYRVESSRFDSAFRCFAQFISSHESPYIHFLGRYILFDGFKSQSRFMSDSNFAFLFSLKDEHNRNKDDN